MLRWTPLLKVFLQDQDKELTALRALGDLMISMQHPEGGRLMPNVWFFSAPPWLISVFLS